MTTWLSKQRKVELVDLADEAGYKGFVNSPMRLRARYELTNFLI